MSQGVWILKLDTLNTYSPQLGGGHILAMFYKVLVIENDWGRGPEWWRKR